MRTLLLDKNYQPIDFITLRTVARLVIKDKAEIISSWHDEPFIKGIKYPSVLKLKDYVRRRIITAKFNRRAIFRRDRFQCQYSGVILPISKLTVDHVIPRCRGGKSTWENCVTASLDINIKKGSKTPEEAGLKLIRKPFAPTNPLHMEYAILNQIHPDWEVYFPDIS